MGTSRLEAQGKAHLIGIGQMMVSSEATAILSAPNLGSCLGIAIYDPIKKQGGLIHCLLPLSKSNPDKAASEPCTFVDTGVVTLLNELVRLGSQKKDLEIIVAGGSNINDSNNVFEIGVKNYTILKKILWKNNLLLKGEDVGSNVSRTVSLHIGSGEVFVKVNGELKRLL